MIMIGNSSWRWRHYLDLEKDFFVDMARIAGVSSEEKWEKQRGDLTISMTNMVQFGHRM